jgi:hypothetical protein
VDLQYFRLERNRGSVPPGKREPQAGVASGLSNSASRRTINAGGDAVEVAAPNIEPAAKGKAGESLPGSKSVATAEADARNWGDPGNSCRTNYESQAGKTPQRQEGVTDETQEVGLAHSTQRQGASPEAGEGANTLTQPPQATGPERKSEQDWQTFLRAIADKALTWKGFNRLLSRFEVPQPHIGESNARRQPCQLELSFFDRVASFLTRLQIS